MPRYLKESDTYSKDNLDFIIKGDNIRHRSIMTSDVGQIVLAFTDSPSYHSDNLERSYYTTVYKSMSIMYGTDAFGFRNISYLMSYFIVLYFIEKCHSDEKLRDKMRREMELINSTFMYYSPDHGMEPLYDVIKNGHIYIPKSFYKIVSEFVEKYESDIRFTALDTIPKYRQSIEALVDNGKVLVQGRLDKPRPAFNTTNALYDSEYISSKSYLLKDVDKNELVRDYTKPYDGDSDDNKSKIGIFNSLLTLFECSSFRIKSMLFPKISKKSNLLELSSSDVDKNIHDRIGNIKFKSLETIYAYLTCSIDNHKHYGPKIRKYGKQKGVTITSKTNINESNTRFKVKAYYSPKNIKSFLKTLKILSEVSAHALISDTDFMPFMKNVVKGNARHNTLQQLLHKKSDEFRTMEREDQTNVYDALIKKSKFTSSIFKYPYTKTVQFISEGLIIDDDVLEEIIKNYLNASSVTFSVHCDDIRDLHKLKLMGMNIDSLEYDIRDSEDVLKYFEEY